MKKSVLIFLSCALMMSAVCVSCETASPLSDEGDDGGAYRVVFQVSEYEQVPFDGQTRASENVTSVCSRIDFAVFSGATRVKNIHQTADDDDFGTISLQLDEGTYRIVALAHSGAGNATVTSPEKITFSNNKLTDTFYHTEEITVSQPMSSEIGLQRAVAMFRLVLNDTMPSTVNQMYFYYTGGSSTLNALTGYGCVQSRQTEEIAVDASQHGRPSQFEIYTFPHAEKDTLKITVKAMTANSIEKTREYDNVPVARNMITQYSGNFFDDSATVSSDTTSTGTPSGAYNATFVADTAWTQMNFTY